MSSLTKCNYCTNKELKEEAKHDGLAITHENDHGVLKGINVYIHPKEIIISKLSEEDKKRYFKAWFMELGTKCEC